MNCRPSGLTSLRSARASTPLRLPVDCSCTSCLRLRSSSAVAIQERVVAGLARAKAQGRSSDDQSARFPSSRLPPSGVCLSAKPLDGSGFLARPSSGRWPEYPPNPPSDFLGKQATLATCWSGPHSLVFSVPIDLTRVSPYIACSERIRPVSVRPSGHSEEVYGAETNCWSSS